MDLKGRIIISRDYRGDVPVSACDKFTKHIAEAEDDALTPIFTHGNYTFVHIKHNNLILMAVTKANANAMIILNFLYRIVSVFTELLNSVVEESIRDNFILIYELLDEMMDYGYPQSTDAKVLKEFLFVKELHALEKKAPALLTQAVNWRQPGIVHKKNEIFLDVIEKLNLLVAADGQVLKSEVLGSVQLRSFLSGMPELKLGLNDKALFQSQGGGRGRRGKAVDMEDIRFHQCVRLSRFENDRTISFIPPDGEFELMSYRLHTKVKPLILIESHVERHKGSRIEYLIKARSNFKRRSAAQNVIIKIPVPSDADSPKFKCSVGKGKWLPDESCVAWTIKNFIGERTLMMRAHFGLPSISSADADEKGEDHSLSAPIKVEFELPYFTISGIQVRYLKIVEKSGITGLPWVRYLTRSGDYAIRIGGRGGGGGGRIDSR
jgi:AP-1 complex subunit mu